MNLDIKDRRILAELDLNARATFQEIGKIAGVSKEVVIYRIAQLEKRKIILRYTTLVNFSKLGYTGFAIYSRFQNVNEKLKQEIIEYLTNIPELYWIALVGGKFDIVCGIMCKTVQQFNKIYYKIMNVYGKNLADNKISIRTELRQHKRNYLLNNQFDVFVPPFFGREITVEKIDALDEEILSLISNNARITVLELAKNMAKPASTISLRMRKLKARGIIQGFTTYIKAQNFGMQSYRLLFSLENMNEIERKKLFSYTNQNSKMILAIETVGEWNFEITLEVENHEELQKEISLLRDAFSGIIKNIDFLIMFEDDLVYDPYPLKKHKNIII
jgi:Lrp/AsnC family transcriptional regulator, leucine-responsive regulatory protein